MDLEIIQDYKLSLETRAGDSLYLAFVWLLPVCVCLYYPQVE